MGINWKKHHLLDCIEDNLLHVAINDFVERQFGDYERAKPLYKQLSLFRDKKLIITSVSMSFHEFLLERDNFADVQTLVDDVPAHAGVILLPTGLSIIPMYATI